MNSSTKFDCLVEGCAQPIYVKSKQLCRTHYNRQWRGKPFHLPRKLTMEEQFSRQLDKNFRDVCWGWKGGKDLDGYGLLTYGGKTYRASRLAYEYSFGSIPKGMFVCHRCDTPGCVNPNHLFLGTGRDNSLDMMRKGRWGGSPTTRLTRDQVSSIRREFTGKYGDKMRLARKYGMSSGQISKILLGKCWADDELLERTNKLLENFDVSRL